MVILHLKSLLSAARSRGSACGRAPSILTSDIFHQENKLYHFSGQSKQIFDRHSKPKRIDGDGLERVTHIRIDASAAFGVTGNKNMIETPPDELKRVPLHAVDQFGAAPGRNVILK
jgi:hypothetical protein